MQRIHTAERETLEATQAKTRMATILEELEKNHTAASIELNDTKRERRALEVPNEKLMWEAEEIERRLRLFTDEPVVDLAHAEVQADLGSPILQPRQMLFEDERLQAVDFATPTIRVEGAQESARSASASERHSASVSGSGSGKSS